MRSTSDAHLTEPAGPPPIAPDLSASAVLYAARGWACLPLQEDGRAIGGLKAEHATTDASVIRRWFENPKATGIGLATGSAFVVLELNESEAQALSAKHGLLNTLQADGPNGQRQFYFRPAPEGAQSAGHAVKGAGDYVVAPPTPGYTWDGLDEDNAAIHDAPDWLLAPPANSGGEAQPPRDVLAAALDLTQRGFEVVPIMPGGKVPSTGKGWQELQITPANISQWFHPDSNLGVKLGINGLTDIDLDCDEALYIADMFLPLTDFKFGRYSATLSHWLYYADPPVVQRGFDDPVMRRDKKPHSKIVERRGTKTDGTIGLQTVVPPSIHESGEVIKFWPFEPVPGPPARVDAETLTRAVEQIAAAVLLARYFPAVDGGRNAAFLALDGALVRHGWEDERIFQFSMAIRRILYRKLAKESMCRAELDHTVKDIRAAGPSQAFPSSRNPLTGWP
jgi:Bifunctional DNA primase/polymerase, N-terminal